MKVATHFPTIRSRFKTSARKFVYRKYKLDEDEDKATENNEIYKELTTKEGYMYAVSL